MLEGKYNVFTDFICLFLFYDIGAILWFVLIFQSAPMDLTPQSLMCDDFGSLQFHRRVGKGVATVNYSGVLGIVH